MKLYCVTTVFLISPTHFTKSSQLYCHFHLISHSNLLWSGWQPPRRDLKVWGEVNVSGHKSFCLHSWLLFFFHFFFQMYCCVVCKISVGAYSSFSVQLTALLRIASLFSPDKSVKIQVCLTLSEIRVAMFVTCSVNISWTWKPITGMFGVSS